MTSRSILTYGLAGMGWGLALALLLYITLAPASEPQYPEGNGKLDCPDLVTAAARSQPAVVSVRGFRDGTGTVASGSGVIIDGRRGLIATNCHVITNARRVRITLPDRREYTAQVIGQDRPTDLALLQIADAPDLPAATFGDSDQLRVGEPLLAVGNPYGLNSTVTTGILSGRGRAIDVLTGEDRIESFLQTDAAVHAGNSGGALVNTAGELIGINTAILTGTGRHEGFAFAIPGNLARRVLDDLRDYGRFRRAELGAFVQSINNSQARRRGMELTTGVVVTELRTDGAARRAGLEKGDVLLSIDDRAIHSAPQLHEVLSHYNPGDRVAVAYRRDQADHAVELTLLGRP